MSTFPFKNSQATLLSRSHHIYLLCWDTGSLLALSCPAVCDNICLFFIITTFFSLQSHLKAISSYLERTFFCEEDWALNKCNGYLQSQKFGNFCILLQFIETCSKRDCHYFKVSQLPVSFFSNEGKTEINRTHPQYSWYLIILDDDFSSCEKFNSIKV